VVPFLAVTDTVENPQAFPACQLSLVLVEGDRSVADCQVHVKRRHPQGSALKKLIDRDAESPRPLTV
jgi:hypothetical protein